MANRSAKNCNEVLGWEKESLECTVEYLVEDRTRPKQSMSNLTNVDTIWAISFHCLNMKAASRQSIFIVFKKGATLRSEKNEIDE